VWRFYLRLLGTAIRELFDATDRLLTVVAAAVFLAVFFTAELGARLQHRWDGLPRWWAVVGLLLFVGYKVLKANYAGFEEQRQRLAAQLAVEATKVASLRRDLDSERERLRPFFRLRVNNQLVASVNPGIKRHPDSVAHLEIILTNSGAQSIAADWACQVKHQGSSVYGTLCVPQKGQVVGLADDAGKPKIDLQRDDFIVYKTTSPIPSGGRVMGWIGVVFEGLTREQLLDADTEWVVSCADADDRRWEVAHKGGEEIMELTYVPGGVEPLP